MVATYATDIVADSPAGWRAELRLRFAANGGRTRIVERQHVGPLVVQRPFYPEGDVCHAYIVHPPGGVVGGDELSIVARLDESAHVLLTTPAAAKFYRSEERLARQAQTFEVNGATLEWLPQESIYYCDAHVRSATRVQLDGDAHFIGWEIACLGLPARAESFSRGRLQLGFELEVDGVPRFIDRLRIDGCSDTPHASWGLQGHTAIGTMLAYPGSRAAVEAARAVAAPGVELAATLVDDVFVCRALGMQGEPVRRALVEVWSVLRPMLLGRSAVAPRIWQT